MAGRKHSIKVKIFTLLLVPLVSLVAIWGYAATLTLQNGLDLLRISNLYDSLIVPTRAVTSALQHERLLSLKLLGDPAFSRTTLDVQRVKTNAARNELARLSADVLAGTSGPFQDTVTRLLTATDRLTGIRSEVDGHSAGRRQTLDAYSSIIDAAFDVYDRIRLAQDDELLTQTKAAVVMGRSRELLSQQAALIAGVTAAKSIENADRAVFAELAGARKLLYSIGVKQLDQELRAAYVKLATTPYYRGFEQIEAAFATASRPDASWASSATALADSLDRIAGDVSRRISDRSKPLATGILVQIGIAGGLGLVAVAASIFISVRFGRRIGTELVSLQETALDLADRRLPSVVARLSKGEDVCPQGETPDLNHGSTAEIVKVGEAFSSVQRTAIQAAVGQAEMRKGVNKVFVNLARRSQTLLHRQLSMLEAMESRASDPETLDELFALDHLTTRMRRHAEGLIILSGSAPGRGWRVPVAVYDVVRAAIEEVEDYLRVTVAVPQGPALVGPAATDVIHLLAELVENAVIFSPPTTTVRVFGETVARGYAIEVEDRGLGMSAAELDHHNARLADPPEFDLADSDRLGLFVVGRLAARHGIRVSLRPSPYGGTTAIVFIPAELMSQPPELTVPSSPASVEVTQTITGSGLPKRTRQAVPQRISATQVAPGERPPAQITSGEAVPPPAAPGGLPRRTRNAAGVEAVVPGSVLTSFRAGWRRGEEEGGER
ncbi:nitrate- and nitrite sensing domain-containing protein [Planobispora longispora]|uniref:histidine kinase n=1 Tax=Planobispora longispora TaxID=28887 RepID=A0A8J3W566_9ACTN|nr:nitrate- and nitrite sensing domain-containing protein [Planobispora longispora]GIH76250.1 hypothetical protein Plo01_26790 [Planobispora longispora]